MSTTSSCPTKPCPMCGSIIFLNPVDIEVGVLYEPAACESCGWHEPTRAEIERTLADFAQFMKDEVIPAIVEDIARREELAVKSREQILREKGGET